jgi:putative intracellular protease/amidase
MATKPKVPADCVKWISSRSKFKVWVQVFNGYKVVGYFKTLEEAYAARKQATIDYVSNRSMTGERRLLRKPDKNSKSGVTGVRWYEQRKRWVAAVEVDGKQISLGHFTELADAVAARQAANLKYGFFPADETGAN